MSGLIATVVDWEALGQASLAALVAGTGVTLFFSFAILGAGWHTEARRSGQRAAAGLALALMLVGLTVSAAAVVGAVVLMITK